MRTSQSRNWWRWFWVLALFLASAQAFCEDGLVAHWTFDEGIGTTAVDSSGNGYDGTLVNGPVWTTGVPPGNALRFNGTNSYVNVPSSPDVGGGSFTVACWIFRESGSERKFVSKWNGNSGNLQFDLQVYKDNCLWFSVCQGNNVVVTAWGTTIIQAGRWYHIGAVADASGALLRVYIDGAPETFQSNPGWDGSVRSVDMELNIGRKASGNDYWQGLIDDVRIYNRALSQAEIQALILPLLAPGDSYSMVENTTLTVPAPGVLVNDYALNGDPISATNFSASTGTLTGNPDGSFSYTPPADFRGTVTFTYQADDGHGNVSAPVTVTITVNKTPSELYSVSPMSADLGFPVNLSLTGAHFPIWSGQVSGAGMVSFDGVDDSYHVPSSNLLNSPTFTIEAWVKDGFQFLKRNGWPGIWEQFNFSCNNGGQAVFWVANNFQRVPLASNASIGSSWMHVAATYDGSTQRIYINGVLDNQNTVNIPVCPWTEYMVLYAEPFWGNTYSRGSMSEFRFWNVARTQTQIASTMNVALTGGDPNLVVRYDMSSGGPNLIDTTGNGHTGTPLGSPTFGVRETGPVGVRLSNASGAIYASGSLTATDALITCSIDLTGAAAGVYDVELLENGIVTATLPGAFTVTVPPILHVTAAETVPLRFTTYDGGPNPIDKTLQIANTGTGAVNWQVTTDAAWLTVTPTTGSTTTATDSLVVHADATALLSANSPYSGTITVTAPGAACSPQMIGVQVFVTDGPGLVAHWTFDEGSGTTAADSSGNGYDGTLVNGPIWTTGLMGPSDLQFDGVSSYVNVPNAPDLGGGSFTVAAWIYPDSDNAITFVSKWDGPMDRRQFDFNITSNRVVGFQVMQSNQATPYAVGIQRILPGRWYFVTAVADTAASQLRIYVNGQPEPLGNTPGWNGTLINCSTGLNLGRKLDGNLPWQGKIDDVRIYNRALSQTEIQALIPQFPPVAQPENYTIGKNHTLTVSEPGVLANDTDFNAYALTAVLDSTTTHGILALSADGSFTYTPDTDYIGPDSFTYHAGDGHGNTSATVTVSLDVYALTTVTGMSPAPNSVLAAPPAGVTLQFSQDIDPATVNTNSVRLVGAGPDGVFGTADDVAISPASIAINGEQVTLDLQGVTLPNCNVQMTVSTCSAALGALAFNGSQCVRIPGAGSWMPTQEITLEFWQNVSSADLGSTFGLTPDDGANRCQAHVPLYSYGNIIWDFGATRCQYTQEAFINTWQHFALVSSQSGNTMQIYRNGVLEQEQSGHGVFTRGVYDFLIGRNGNMHRFNGKIDEFRIWSVMRTQAQIQGNMYRTLTGNEFGLEGCWDFSEGSGQIVHDKSPYARHGTIGWDTQTGSDDPTWLTDGAPLLQPISDLNGNVIDGEFTGTFPSGDGAPGGDFVGTFRVDAPPDSESQAVTTHSGVAKAITLAASDADKDPLTFTVGLPAHGTLSGTAPNLIYAPAAGYAGPDSFTYSVNDGIVDSNVATVSIEVVNAAPLAADQNVSTHSGLSKSILLGGSDADGDPLVYSVVTQPAHGTLSGTAPNLAYSPAAGYAGTDSFTFKANDGVADSNIAVVAIAVTNTAPVASAQTAATHWGTAKSIALSGTDADGDILTYSIVAPPQNGTISGAAPNLIYTPAGNFVGADSFTFKVNDGVGDSPPAGVSITITNAAPTLNASASPISVVPNSEVSFSATGSDPDNDALTYLWEFGDGTTSAEQSPAHSYASVGTYTASVTVTDGAGASASASVLIQVSQAPTPRITTSDVVGFGNLPFTFDASASTDPENQIASYTWDFGDGTPLGSGQIISKIYDQPGSYNVTLTIVDAAGVSTTLQRVVEVLPESEAGLFNAFVRYNVRWNRKADKADALILEAKVNVGDTLVKKGTTLAIEIAGQRFTAVLDRKLRDYNWPKSMWQAKSGIRGVPYGTVSLKAKLQYADLGAAFNRAGAVFHGDAAKTVNVDIPLKLEIGDRSFEIDVPSAFEFNGDGTRANGTGSL
ncbi:MAG TPA: LamG-like jellyroll fold domain-containing protein [Planctomycetota bacterium]|jgi:PKD repeat protein